MHLCACVQRFPSVFLSLYIFGVNQKRPERQPPTPSYTYPPQLICISSMYV